MKDIYHRKIVSTAFMTVTLFSMAGRAGPASPHCQRTHRCSLHGCQSSTSRLSSGAIDTASDRQPPPVSSHKTFHHVNLPSPGTY